MIIDIISNEYLDLIVGGYDCLCRNRFGTWSKVRVSLERCYERCPNICKSYQEEDAYEWKCVGVSEEFKQGVGIGFLVVGGAAGVLGTACAIASRCTVQ